MAGVGVFAAVPAGAGAQLSDSGNAAQVQYPDMPTREPEPEPDQMAPTPPAGAPAPAPAPAPGPAAAPADDSGLPMTGFVAIPLLITGALLLIAGGVMHVRTRDR